MKEGEAGPLCKECKQPTVARWQTTRAGSVTESGPSRGIVYVCDNLDCDEYGN